MRTLDPALEHWITKRGVAQIIPEAEFLTRLREGKPLRLKMGFDPSRPDLHLGHVVGLRKLRQLQELGHHVVVIVGDWTAQIGDPSGRSDTRTMLTADEVAANAETYMRQFFRVVDRDRAEARYQTEWYGDFGLAEVVRLTSHFTVNQFLHRDDFAKRYAEQAPIAVTELLYPLLQAYDSVAVRSDVEFGGTDQLFNLMVGRELQEKSGQRPQDVFLMPILPGTDGVRRMGKSLGNYIAIEDPPDEMFGKVMSLPDDVIPLYYELLTDMPDAELADMRATMEVRGVNPMSLKKDLGRELVGFFHGMDAANAAQAEFERVFQQRETPTEVPELRVSAATEGAEGLDETGFTADLSRLLPAAGLVGSRGEARRLLGQNGVEVEGQRVGTEPVRVAWGSLVRAGRRRFVRLVRG
jgi:tyrosyl-tRNA synthetase